MTNLYDFKIEYTFSGDRLSELDRGLCLLLSTRAGSLPLDREFGLNADFLDLPPETAKSLYTAEVAEKVAKYMPDIRVKSVSWQQGSDGAATSKVVITSV